ncbi:HNH endonuclease signature motif containing protein [Sediminivirga luteola]|uniref:DUF222 domain-containing protein n=1 Tax=Sediminivirga luteola TaxID=1774748 RepID=A0A8J2TYV6_9MICO|nr:HNH endonuclease signature motif containing protein [Sediminivirga luteola]MCI2264147.1 HNH endonuclease [Sediminivirga luteola]GGA17798.1 hypothetical protein GCM10011333_21160 [Sediminivirga luteola]
MESRRGNQTPPVAGHHPPAGEGGPLRRDAAGRLAGLSARGRDRAAAEARELSAALEHLDAECARIERGARTDRDGHRAAGAERCGRWEIAEAERGAVLYEIGRALGWSPAQASLRLSRAVRARESLPVVWELFLDGGVDAARIYVLADAAGRLLREDSRDVLDRRAVEYAPRHTVGELRAWARRLIAELESDQGEERARMALAERRVCVEHRDDGVSELWALLPTMHAAMIDQALTKAGRKLAGGGVTVAQARADVLADALTGGTVPLPAAVQRTVGPERRGPGPEVAERRGPGPEPERPEPEAKRGSESIPVCACHGRPVVEPPFAKPGDRPTVPPQALKQSDREGRRQSDEVCHDGHASFGPAHARGTVEHRRPGCGIEALRDVRVHIGVTVPAEALAGDAEAPVVSEDGSWVVPLSQLRELAGRESAGRSDPRVFWHRILLGRSGDVLAHEYAGRFPPETLRVAIGFRDGTCSVPGCPAAAAVCDLDHRSAWPHGATSGSNLWALCRKHHRWKTMGVIRPVRLSGPDRRWGWTLPSGGTAPVKPEEHQILRQDLTRPDDQVQRGELRAGASASCAEEALRQLLVNHLTGQDDC